MYIKIFIASLSLAIVSGLIAFATTGLLGGPVWAWIALATFLGGLLTSTWVSASSGARVRQQRPRRSRPAISRGAGNSAKETGSVKWFSPSKGFGFITRDNGEDIFVHFRSILGKGHRVLREGQRVEFAVTQGSKGLQAEEVVTLK